jgi:hypothetical protein
MGRPLNETINRTKTWTKRLKASSRRHRPGRAE